MSEVSLCGVPVMSDRIQTEHKNLILPSALIEMKLELVHPSYNTMEVYKLYLHTASWSQ